MSWAEHASKVKVGDKVAISAGFLRSTGQQTGDLSEARGTVTGLKSYGEITVATVDWGSYEVDPKILTKYLSRVTERGVMDLD